MVVDRIKLALLLAIAVGPARGPGLVKLRTLAPLLVSRYENICRDEKGVFHLWGEVVILCEVPIPVVEREVSGLDVVELGRCELRLESAHEASSHVGGDFVIILVRLLNV